MNATDTSMPISFDISGETEHHVFVARGTDQFWQGHPNTVLLPDGRTIFCSWAGRQDGTFRHGAPGGLLKRSDDGGLTWSDLLDVPENWREIGRGHPTIVRRGSFSSVTACLFTGRARCGCARRGAESRLLTFEEGSREVLVRCYMHTDEFLPQGWCEKAERRLTLSRPLSRKGPGE